MRTPRCTDRIDPKDYRPGMRRVKAHSFECWGTDNRHNIQTGFDEECWIYVCNAVVQQTGEVCGYEKCKLFRPVPDVPEISPCPGLLASATPEHLAEHQAAAEAFWLIYDQEEARMGRSPVRST